MKSIVIIVTYNRKELLKESIEALINQTNKNFDLLIVDNASTDNTYNDIVSKYESNKIKYINTQKNLGGAGGFNFGLKRAILDGYDYAWVMDDDSICTNTAFESIMNKAKVLNYEFSYISSKVNWTDGSLCKMNRVELDKDGIQENYNLVSKNMLAIKTASFVGCFINLKYARMVGLPIKEFFIYADDFEYTMRLSNVQKAYLDLDSVIVHKMKDNNTSEINTVSEQRIDRYFYDFRNVMFINIKVQGIMGFIKSIYRYLKYVVKILKSKNTKKWKRICIITKGTFCGMFFRPKIEIVNEGENNV